MGGVFGPDSLRYCWLPLLRGDDRAEVLHTTVSKWVVLQKHDWFSKKANLKALLAADFAAFYLKDWIARRY